MPATKTARISIMITLLLVILVAALFFFFVDLEEVGTLLRHADPAYLAAATLLLLAGFLVYAVRWQLLLHRVTSLPDTFHASNLGHLLNMLLPLRPGEAMRIVALNRRSGAGVGQLTSSVVIERMMDTLMRLAAFGGMLVVGIGFTNSPGILAGLGAFLLVAMAGLVWMVKEREKVLQHVPKYLGYIPRLSEERLRHSLAELLDALVVMSSPRRIVLGLLTSALSASLFWGFHYLTLLALDFPLVQSQMLALSLGILVISPPSSPTLPGVYHAQLVLPFAALGISSSNLTAYAILLYALQGIAVIAMGAWALYKTSSSLTGLLRRRQPVPLPVEVDLSTGD